MNSEIMEFIQLKNVCDSITQNLTDGFKTQVNIGGNFFMSAKVADTKHIMINVGLNHYVDFTISEAIKFCDFKIKSLENEANVIREKSIETRAKIKLALLCLAEKEELLNASSWERKCSKKKMKTIKRLINICALFFDSIYSTEKNE